MGNIPVYTIHLPEYSVDSEPDHKALGKEVDDEIRKHFLGETLLVRALGSMEHPGKTADELIEIIKRDGTDRYDPDRAGDRYKNTLNKHIDLYALRRKITERTKLFWQLSWSFYASPKKTRGYPVKVDILVIYEPSKLKAVVHQPEGNPDIKRDGFVFRDPENKQEAVRAIFRIV